MEQEVLKRKIMIVFEETDVKGGMRVSLQGDSDRIGVTQDHHLSGCEFWAGTCWTQVITLLQAQGVIPKPPQEPKLVVP